jgi:hypothetical protein
MAYELLQKIDVSARDVNPVIFTGVKSSTVLIKLERLGTSINSNIVRNIDKTGSRIRYRQSDRYGDFRAIYQGETELTLDIPLPESDYQLEFFPASSLWDYSISVFIVGISDLMLEYQQLTGESLDSIRSIPITYLRQLLMASTDIRSFKKMVSDLNQSVAQQAEALTVQGAKVVSMETSMVIEKSFTVAKAAFNKVGDYWIYDLNHNMASLTPDVTIYDADKDLQSIQTIVQSSSVLRLELSEEEYQGNSFPLEVTVQAKNAPVAYVGTEIGNGIFFSLSDGVLRRKDGNEWVQVDSNVTAAKHRNGRAVYIVAGNVQAPKISQSSNNWVPVVGSANDWSPDEDNSPVIAA